MEGNTMENNIVRAKEAYSKFGITYTAMNLVYYAAVLTVMMLFKLITKGDVASSIFVQVADYGIRFAIIYPVMYLLIRDIPKFDIEKKKLGIGGFIASAIIAYTIMYISNVIGIALNSTIGKITGIGGVTPLIDALAQMPLALQIVVVVILAPIFEELLFRKFLLDRVANFGEVPAMLLSGFMFGLYHANLSQFVYAFAIGCFFAFIYLRTGNIAYTIVLHMIINGASTFLTNKLLGGVDAGEMMSYLNNGDMEGYNRFIQDNAAALAGTAIFGFIMIAVVIAGIVLMITLRKKFVFENHAEEIEKSERFGATVLNIGMIIYIVFYIAMIVSVQCGVDPFGSLASALGLY